MEISLLTRMINGLLMIVFPIAVGLFLTRRFGYGWRLWWIGAASFIISQILHIPFNFFADTMFKQELITAPPESWGPAFNAVFLGLSAGFWEELTLYGVYRWWAKDARTWSKGILIGTGRGGIESILIGLYVLIIYVQMVIFRYTDLATILPEDQMGLIKDQVVFYWSIPWYDTLLGALERLFTIIFHISASILVIQVFIRKQLKWLWFAILWHAIVDAGAVYLVQTISPYAAELWLGLVFLLSFGLIFALRDPYSGASGVDISPPPKKEEESPIYKIEITKEKLNQSRYM